MSIKKKQKTKQTKKRSNQKRKKKQKRIDRYYSTVDYIVFVVSDARVPFIFRWYLPAVRCAQIYIPCTYNFLSCTKLREWFGVNFWQMLQDTFATSQIQFVFEITLIALKYKQYNFKLSPKMDKRRW